MARSKKPAKPPVIESGSKYGMSPDQYKAMEAWNNTMISCLYNASTQAIADIPGK